MGAHGERSRVLVIDHYFDQDLQELVRLDSGFEFKKVSAEYFARKARRFFPKEVFDGPLECFADPRYAQNRIRWRSAAREALYRLYALWPFDLVIAPSDTFFYIRDVVLACRELGLPFVVVQKETTISPATMEIHSQQLKTHFPFIGDFMTVCSERHGEFWVRVGADPSRIRVTGQPRFDFYKREEWPSSSRRSGGRGRGERYILFLSYELDAYAITSPGVAVWRSLRETTEDVLVDVARSMGVRLVIKPHPQQDPRDVKTTERRLQERAGELWGRDVILVPRDADTRPLIANADAVVGFQTTALMEALMAGVPIIYTRWGPVLDHEEGLIPFHQCLLDSRVATSPEDLREKVIRTLQEGAAEYTDQERAFAEEYLGPFDGQNAKRVLAEVSSFLEKFRPEKVDAHLTSRILRYRRWVAGFSAAWAAVRAVIAGGALLLFSVIPIGFSGNARLVQRLQSALRRFGGHARESIDILLSGCPSAFEIIGPP